MSIKKLLLLCGLCVFFVGCTTGGYNPNLARYAKEGNAKLGVRYLFGRGLPENHVKAFEHFYQAAKAGDPFAQNEVAYLYAAGKGTPRNPAKALFWYQKAADHGLASAQYNLGLMYLYGLGTEPNKATAKKWIAKSAANGFSPAKQALNQL